MIIFDVCLMVAVTLHREPRRARRGPIRQGNRAKQKTTTK